MVFSATSSRERNESLESQSVVEGKTEPEETATKRGRGKGPRGGKGAGHGKQRGEEPKTQGIRFDYAHLKGNYISF